MNFSIDDPETWSADDPVLWMHEEWYRARHGLSKESAPGIAPPPTTNQGPSRVDKELGYNQPQENADGIYRIEGVDVTEQELLNRLKDTKRSISEEHFMRNNGDPLGDLEMDWYAELKPFLDPNDDVNKDYPFALWNAKQHFKLDKKIEKKLSKAENANVPSQTGIKTTPKSALQLKGSLKAAAKSRSAKLTTINEKKQEELKMQLLDMKKALPKLKQGFLRLERACRQGDIRKSDLDQIVNDIKILYTLAKRV